MRPVVALPILRLIRAARHRTANLSSVVARTTQVPCCTRYLCSPRSSQMEILSPKPSARVWMPGILLSACLCVRRLWPTQVCAIASSSMKIWTTAATGSSPLLPQRPSPASSKHSGYSFFLTVGWLLEVFSHVSDQYCCYQYYP